MKNFLYRPIRPARFARMLGVGLLVGLLGLVNPLLAQSGSASLTVVPPGKPGREVMPPRPPVFPLIFPRLMVPEAKIPVALDKVDIRTEIVGQTAQSRIEFIFRNPNDRVLEGELQFPLLPGQSVSGFALDINGELRQAVPVPKAKGQQVFEDVTRARVDPALLEVTQGNNYKLRVYPLPPQDTRRVVLEIAEVLSAPVTGKGKAAKLVSGLQYRLPLQFASKIGQLDVAVHVADLPQKQLQINLTHMGGSPDVKDSDSGTWVAVSRKDYTGKGVLTLDLPPLAALGGKSLVSTEQRGNETYFYAEVPLQGQTAPRANPGKLALFWDASGSGASRDHAKEFALLDAYFKAIRDTELELQVLRNTAEAPRHFSIRQGDWRELRQVLEALPYDGATDLAALNRVAGADLALLFSDGLGNYGTEVLKLDGSVPLYAVNAAVSNDATRLCQLAEKRGGRLLDLLRQNTAEAVQELRTRRTRLQGLSGNGVKELVSDGVYAEKSGLALAGVLTAAQGTVELEIQTPSGSILRQKLEIKPQVARNSGIQMQARPSLAAQRWASLKIAQLEADVERNRASIARLGMGFGLVTKETSLIVLDTVQDYVRYEIEPPESLKPEYTRLLATRQASKAQERSTHLEQVVARFNDKAKWWDKEFPKGDKPAPEPVRKPARAMLFDESGASMARETAMPRPTPMVMAPPPSPVAVERSNTAINSPVQIQGNTAIRASQHNASAVAVAKGGSDAGNGASPAATIQLKKWEPDAAYARRMREAKPEDLYAIYLDERPGYLNSTAFFLDAADIFIGRGQQELGLRILSNLAEMNLENRHILRILGYRLLQAKQPQLAIPVLEKVKALSPNEPQSWRDLGLAHEAAGQPQQAIDALWEVVAQPWHGRFPDVELIALAELNAIAARNPGLDTQRIDSRLLRNLPLDLRVVLAWDADNTDIDLWVTDPNGEKAYFANRLSYQGGSMSRDFTGGYGPEEFSLRTAKPGKYLVQAQFYGHNQQLVAGATTLMMRLTTGFGTPQQKDETVMMRLQGRSELITVGEFTVGGR
jgi:hypothetical protein